VDAPAYVALIDDLEAEEGALDATVSDLDDAGWATPTPAAGWDVRDSIAHLAATDDWAVLALSDPDAFRAQLAGLGEAPDERARAIQSGTLGRRVPEDLDTIDWWRERRSAVVELLRGRSPLDRSPWFGPDMASASFATARLMETWAHGRDVYDALAREQPATSRVRHVADLGVRTRGWSYVARGLEPPTTPVRVELAAPDGSTWEWDDPGAPASIRGLAIDFCLVVTQRRNPADTGLAISGDAAVEWMSIAQAFAGAPTGQRDANS
jgi:uncharacterized protein (TIGR03084 family)